MYQMRVMSLSVTVVVVSQNPAFLDAFAELSLKGRLQMWSTKLIIHTNLPFSVLQGLHKLLSTRNCMLLLANELYVKIIQASTSFLGKYVSKFLLESRRLDSTCNLSEHTSYYS